MNTNPPIATFHRCVSCGSSGLDVRPEMRYHGETGDYRVVNVCADDAACRARWAWRWGQINRSA